MPSPHISSKIKAISNEKLRSITKRMQSGTTIQKSLDKWKDFASFWVWYPDLVLDLIKPKEGGINLCFDQRVYLRILARFFSVYGSFPRGSAKSWGGVISEILCCIRFPRLELSQSAQTRENSVRILKDRYHEIMRQYPMLANEVAHSKFSDNTAEIIFKNGSRLSVISNTQSSKGLRRNRLGIEESVLMDDVVFQDALAPVVEVSRYTIGSLSLVNPEELNQQINFFSTPGFRGSTEYDRNIRMIHGMRELTGEFVIGSSWLLPCYYGRGSSKNTILKKKESMSPIAFAQNYGGIWTGSSSGSLVNINKLMKCRTLTESVLESDKQSSEFFLGVDVARSQNTGNNQSSVAVVRVIRNASGRVSSADVVNIFHISNLNNFASQAVEIKKIRNAYNARMVVVDGNGLGTGLVDELLKSTPDPITGEPLGCWNTVNTTNRPEQEDAEKCLYDLKAQGAQSRIVSNFIAMVDSGKLRLLEKREANFFEESDAVYERQMLPFIETDLLIEETSNLKLKIQNNGSLTVEQVVSKMNKDRFSALAYVLWYINEFENVFTKEAEFDLNSATEMVTSISF